MYILNTSFFVGTTDDIGEFDFLNIELSSKIKYQFIKNIFLLEFDSLMVNIDIALKLFKSF